MPPDATDRMLRQVPRENPPDDNTPVCQWCREPAPDGELISAPQPFNSAPLLIGWCCVSSIARAIFLQSEAWGAAYNREAAHRGVELLRMAAARWEERLDREDREAPAKSPALLKPTPFGLATCEGVIAMLNRLPGRK